MHESPHLSSQEQLWCPIPQCNNDGGVLFEWRPILSSKTKVTHLLKRTVHSSYCKSSVINLYLTSICSSRFSGDSLQFVKCLDMRNHLISYSASFTQLSQLNWQQHAICTWVMSYSPLFIDKNSFSNSTGNSIQSVICSDAERNSTVIPLYFQTVTVFSTLTGNRIHTVKWWDVRGNSLQGYHIPSKCLYGWAKGWMSWGPCGESSCHGDEKLPSATGSSVSSLHLKKSK